jgi:hypothetical protein
MIERELTVVAVHGEGDQSTVNALQQHRYRLDRIIDKVADEPPDIIVVLRDDNHTVRVDWVAQSWQEVEQWKELIGFDENTRHWKQGAKIKVRFGE